MMEERGMTRKDLARLYKGSIGEFEVMCGIKCGFNRAYQIAEIFDCSVDDILIYSEDKSPKRNKKKRGKNG